MPTTCQALYTVFLISENCTRVWEPDPRTRRMITGEQRGATSPGRTGPCLPPCPAPPMPRPKRLPVRDTRRGFTSRFPLAFRRILWVTTTEERTEKGMIRYRGPRRQCKARGREEEPPGPQIPNGSDELQPPGQREVWRPHPRTKAATREGEPDAKPQPPSDTRGRAGLQRRHVLDIPEALKASWALRRAPGSPLRAQEGDSAGQGGAASA